MTKARVHGPDYMYTLLMSYEDPPDGVTVMDGMYYNPAFPGGQIGMPQMIYDETIEYEDGSPNSADDISRDITAFLNWAAEPELESASPWASNVIFNHHDGFVLCVKTTNLEKSRTLGCPLLPCFLCFFLCLLSVVSLGLSDREAFGDGVQE